MKTIRVSISELAKICGVSPGTVDRALNNRKEINAATKEKILRVAKEYGYRPHISDNADKIRGQIGIIVFNLENEYFAKLVTELEQILSNINYSANIMLSHCDKSKEIECIRNLYNMGVDGIIMCPVNSGEEFDNYLSLFDIPIVTTGNDIGSLPYIGVDDFNAMREFTQEILKEDFDEIIYFSQTVYNKEAYAQQLRYRGFVDGAKGKNYSVVSDINDIKETYEYKTLIVCSSDYYALKVYFKTDNAVITGFDNIDILDKYKIKIDSVAYSMKDISQGAVDCLINRSGESRFVRHSIVKRR
ncbi:MAG: LacI family DNA-binding transcriptional regulator [Clostridia bacterium]|nr:LacI family DNA-binding transcriptional regulator [Clostridia bacterium]